MPNPDTSASIDFIRSAVEEDLRTGRFDRVHTRFPPEPNGYLHIGTDVDQEWQLRAGAQW